MRSLRRFFGAQLGENVGNPESRSDLPYVLEPPPVAGHEQIRNVNLGLDFGTSTTKVIARIDGAGIAQGVFAILPPLSGGNTVLFPSTVAIEDDTIAFGQAAEDSRSPIKARSFKMNLPLEAGIDHATWRHRFALGSSGLSAEDVSSLYLGWVLSEAKQRLYQHLGKCDLRLLVNCAAPLDQMQADQGLVTLFHRIVFHAMQLADHALPRWPLDDARSHLATVRRTPVPVATESPVTVLPETHAAMTAHMLRPGARNGLFASVDVGAGTTDVAFFWFHNTGDEPEACYYGARSDYVGLDDVDHACAQKHGISTSEARDERQGGRMDLEAVPLEGELSKIYGVYRQAFGRAFDHCRGDRQWVDQRTKSAKYTLCVVGGGACEAKVRDRISRALPLLGMQFVDVAKPAIPEDVPVVVGPGQKMQLIQIAPQEAPLLVLAYGLAHRAVDIPLHNPNDTFAVAIRHMDRPTHEEIYAK